MDISTALRDRIDLYEALNIIVRTSEELSKVSVTQIKRNFRQQALKYHPDKNPDNSDAVSRFYLMDVAVKLLSDPESRRSYDQWYIQTFLKQKNLESNREQQRLKLVLREKASISPVTKVHDTTDFEEYGHFLRKLKHFKIPYGDWKNFDKYPKTFGHKFQDSCSLRFELSNNKVLQDKGRLEEMLSRTFEVKIIELSFSSRNNYVHDHSIVAYATLATIDDTLRVLSQWESKANHKQSSKTLWSYLEDVSSKVPPSAFKFDGCDTLSPRIREMLANEPIIID
ncbi:LANO_0G02432g1_1 [Lachancea nothofagi CBS 11611]|uniref:LANO_0G02432g1_1 n=1 Tax=Lachancea nothofagi CBS 11611 TaxID=1266666 RepID=A0A1G4KF76_9SACH|nr:LANO_0G02432g1_1 [Lachancea nothofagi CBS 11611]